MSWHPDDLLVDADLAAYETGVLTRFGREDFASLRTKAFEDWLFPALRERGFDPYQLRTRYECDAVYGYTGATYTDKTGAAASTSTDDVSLAGIFATPGTDYLYIGSTQPFRGVFLGLRDSASSASGTLTVEYWNGAWDALVIDDRTRRTQGKTLSAGGSVTWAQPTDWAGRTVNGSATSYWVRLSVSATPTGATASQIGVIRSSVFRGPLTFWTLQSIFQDALTGTDGPWTDKAQHYERRADAALERALAICGGEFDTDASELVSSDEASQTPEEAGGGPWVLERG